MEMLKAMLGSMWEKAKRLFGWVKGLPKRFVCWLHDKFCDC